MKTKLSHKFWLALTLFGLMGQVAWVVENMYLNVFIYKMFNASPAEISAMVAASAVSATVTTLLIGALSDKLGKRKIFICGGYILWGISIFSFILLRTETLEAIFPMTASAAALGANLTIIFDCIMTFFGSSANDAAFNAWVTDSTDATNRGTAEGINSMMPLVSILVVFGGFMFFDLDRAESWTLIFTIIGAVVTLIGVLGFFIIKDANVEPSRSGYFKNVVYGFIPSVIAKHPELYATLISFIVFNISIQIFMPYLIIYYEVSLGMKDYVLIMAPAIILAAAATAFWGKVYDKKGFSFSSTFSLVSLAAGYVLLYFFRSYALVFAGSLLMMCGYLCSMAVFGAKIRDLTPSGKAGRFQGVRICAQVLLPGIIGPYIGKAVLKNADVIVNNDGTESFVPNANIFLAALIAVAVLALMLIVLPRFKRCRTCELKTPFDNETANTWESAHPSPSAKRDTYLNLCGAWELSVKSYDGVRALGKIRVPFSPESALSGIGRPLGKRENYIYEKTFTLTEGFSGKRTLLHFGAVDQICEVYVNDRFATENTGGYLPFSCDITELLKDGENTIRVFVTDKLDKTYAYGKQRKNRGGMWYTPISGIWQSVWLEAVAQKHIESFKLTPSLDSVRFDVVGGEKEKTIVLESGEKYIFEGDTYTLKVTDPINWTPENPKLYYFTLICGEDKIESYFALRTIDIQKRGGKPYICLNGEPYFFHGLLDQGYYPDGIYTPASPSGYEYDILKMKSLGFNMLRKHIKIEPDVFYYYCDKYGMAVFQDMVNSGPYSFILDTALPTVGIKKGLVRRAKKARKEHFEQSSCQTQELLYNHPCVCYYTIFNEGWGQYREADAVYSKLKGNDPSRIYDTASGWFVTKKSDVISDHVYFKKADMKMDSERPAVLSEFGGYSCKVEGHSFNLDNTYGYKYFTTSEALTEGLVKLYREEIIPMANRGLCAAVLTQVSDVEDETNGLVTYDREVVKTDEVAMRAIAQELKEAFLQGIAR